MKQLTTEDTTGEMISYLSCFGTPAACRGYTVLKKSGFTWTTRNVWIDNTRNPKTGKIYISRPVHTARGESYVTARRDYTMYTYFKNNIEMDKKNRGMHITFQRSTAPYAKVEIIAKHHGRELLGDLQARDLDYSPPPKKEHHSKAVAVVDTQSSDASNISAQIETIKAEIQGDNFANANKLSDLQARLESSVTQEQQEQEAPAPGPSE